jgi:hypothetical protein
VTFSVKLVELAYRYANEDAGCRINHWDDIIDIAKLFAEMGLEKR